MTDLKEIKKEFEEKFCDDGGNLWNGGGVPSEEEVFEWFESTLNKQREEMMKKIEKMRPKKRKMKMVTNNPAYEYKSGWVAGQYRMFEDILSKLSQK
jgi:hypothetical protein